jgi:hypothetical protein
MSGESPVVELYDSDGNPLAVQNGAIIPANTPTILVAGSDGTISRYLLVDGYARLVVVGPGTPGLPVGGVVTVQGVVGGTNLPVAPVRSTTPNDTSVAASASNVTLLTSNSNRLGATIWNESTTETLYLKLGTTASLTSYSAQLFPSGYYEVPYGYTGRIDGIWTSASGNARITELT